MSNPLLNFLKSFVPPILSIKKLRYYKNRILNYDKLTNKINYEINFYKRHAFINKAIFQYHDCRYLEIGVFDNDLFNSIPLNISNKYGVDPERGGNFRMTSDEFFKKYPDLMFDVIFIDGLHEFEQCQRDCINSIKHLKKDGIIIFHDMLPRSYYEEHVPRQLGDWKGDVWKVAVELSSSKKCEFKIVNIDNGIGLLKIEKDFTYKKIDGLDKKNFDDFLEYYKNLPIIKSEEGLKFIQKKL